jgi:sulfite reductase (NADPH) flavoprotein alpha-component
MSKDIAIYFGTMTGNSEALAQSTYDKVVAEGWNATLTNLADTKVEDLLANAHNALFVVSTWGDGEPPADAESFFAELGESAVSLNGFKHAVFGLGDSNYEQFNAFAKNLDAALAKLGSKPAVPVFPSDVSYEDDYAKWEAQALAALGA